MTENQYIHGTASQSISSTDTPACGSSGIQVYSCKYIKNYKTADITGVGELHISCGLLSDGNTLFTGYELFSGAVSGYRGSFIMRVHGKFDSETGVASAEHVIEEGSGTDELWAIGGVGSYAVDRNGYCSFELDFSV